MDPNNDRLPDGRGSGILQYGADFPPIAGILLIDSDRSHVVSTVAIQGAQVIHALSPTTVLSTGISSRGRRQVELFANSSGKEWVPTTLWKSFDKAKKVSDDTQAQARAYYVPAATGAHAHYLGL